jgi:hypothetical protein
MLIAGLLKRIEEEAVDPDVLDDDESISFVAREVE